MKKFRIIFSNIIIVVLVILTIVFYAVYQQYFQVNRYYENFRRATRMMEDVVSSDILAEQKLCDSRAHYINDNQMTMEEAVQYVRQLHTDDISGHIVRMDTLEGLSTTSPESSSENIPVSYAGLDVIDVQQMEDGSDINMTQSYVNPIDGSDVVAFYQKVQVFDEEGTSVPAIYLRVVRLSALERQWVFSSYYETASLVLMEDDGDYVVRPDSLTGSNLFETLSSYRGKEIQTEDLRTAIKENSDGAFYGKNADKEGVYFAYSHLRVNGKWVMVGMIPTAAFRMSTVDWTIPVIIIVALAGILMVDVLFFKKTILQRYAAQRTMLEQLNVIEVLSHEFSSIWLVDECRRRCRMYRGTDDILRQLKKKGFRTEGNYDAFMDKYIDSFISEEYKEDIRSQVLREDFFREIPEDGSIYSLNFAKNAGGEIGYFQMCFARIQHCESGIVLGFRNIDATVRKEIQQNELLRDALNQVEAANQAKSTFLSMMSHDMRTPLNGIMGMTAVAESHLEEPERVADCLHKINVSGEHLLGLVNGVLDMSKIESGKIELAEEPFKISELMEKLLAMSRQQVEEHHHELVVNADNIVHERVSGDGLRLLQVFINLLSNAAKYTPDGGRICVTLEEVSEKSPEGYGFYELSVEDNGIGMEPEFIQQIFEPFTRAEDRRISKIQGSGLGMPISRNIVRMMGGDILVESSLGAGSKFTATFFLKLREQEKDAKTPGISTENPVRRAELGEMNLNGRRLLLVEDNELNAEIATELLERTGIAVEWADNGQTAVNRVAESAEDYYDIVFMDLQMPLMNGYEAVKAIRSMDRKDARTLPVIAVSANAFAEDIYAARKAGMNGHISKPLEPDAIAEVLREWVVK